MAVPLAWTQADIHLGRDAPPSGHGTAITALTWNTEYWEPADRLRGILRKEDADIIFLQEHIDGRFRPLGDTADLAGLLEGYSHAASGQLVTLSRLPILANRMSPDGSFLRTELRTGGRRLTVYNVHVPVQLLPELVWEPIRFARDLRTRHGVRIRALRLLEEDLRSTTGAVLVAGDFNSTTAMGVMAPLLRTCRDSALAASPFPPGTWTFGGPRWWRLDYALLCGDGAFLTHKLRETGGGSDHAALRVTFTLDAQSTNATSSGM